MDNFLNNCSSKNQIPLTCPLPQVMGGQIPMSPLVIEQF